MFFDEPQLAIRLLGVLEFDEQNADYWTAPRPFCALSLRTEAETEIEFRGRTLPLHTGDLAFFPAQFGYRRRAVRDKMIVFHFTLPECPWPEPEVLPSADRETLEPLFRRALERWNRQEPGYYYETAALLFRILGETAGQADSRETAALVAAARDYLRQHFEDPALNIAAVARALHVSDSYLRRQFRQTLGTSPKQTLDAIRFERAKMLLNAGYDSVAAVAEKVGFSDEKTFSTAFRRTFGYPPSRQRYGL